MSDVRRAKAEHAAPEECDQASLLTVVTTCKGRLAHLKQSLPVMVATGLPVVLVDYDCPDGARHHAEQHFPGVQVVVVNGRPIFNLAAARNLGAAAVRSASIFFCDCDVLIGDALSDALHEIALSERVFLTGGNGTLHGQCIVAKAAFDCIGGYDEVIAGWGGEDGDFYLRLQAAGYRREMLPTGLLRALPHSDRDRVAFTGGGNPKTSHRLNVAYATIKRDLEALGGAPLSLEQRREIRALVIEAFAKAARTRRPSIIACPVPIVPGPVAHLLDGSGDYRLTRHLRYEIANVSPSRFSRLRAALQERRIVSGLRRRIQGRRAPQ